MTSEQTGTGVITEPPDTLRCEIAVIGSGPGGAITAALLAEAGRDVLLIEDGPFLPLDSCRPFSREEMEQKYRNGGINVTLGSPRVAYEEARCVGGGSEINSGLYYRLPDEVLVRWQRDFQVNALSPSDLLPHCEAIESELGISYLTRTAPLASLKLKEGAERLNWKNAEVPRWYRCTNPSAAAENHKMERNSMTRTFVPKALSAGGRLLAETRVRRMRRPGDRWQLKCLHTSNGRKRRLEIDAQVVFIAGGAIQSPSLLRRSGIKRNIGNSLCMHPTVKIIARFPEEVNYDDMGVAVHGVREFAPRFFFTCSISAPAYLGLGLHHYPGALTHLEADWKRMAAYAAMTTGGCGTVRCVPGFLDPLVRFRFSDHDLEEAASAVYNLSKLLFAAGAEALFPGVPLSSPLLSADELTRLPRRIPRTRLNLGTVHLFSTCPMGENRTRCAADSFGKLHEVDSAYVADASLLCTAPCVNPQGPLMAIVRRNALAFLERK